MINNMQKDKFLAGEGDRYFKRNFIQSDNEKIEWIKNDPLLPLLLDLPFENDIVNVLEIGCGQGLRLQELKNKKNWITYGLDPSLEAFNNGKRKGINVYQGTADKLPFNDRSMDILIYGFCLYLCDYEDLFKIAAEADRVLKKRSWIAIMDFWSSSPRENTYKHDTSMNTFKNNRNLIFDWHPFYEVVYHKIIGHKTTSFTDNVQEKVSVSLLRRYG